MTERIESVNKYLNLLKEELAESDRATIQDALSDAEEHLRTALNDILETETDISETEAMPAIIEEYGSPGEVAAAYRDIEARVRPALAQSKRVDERPLIARFFGVYADPRAWGALFYALFALLTGIIYFTWAVTGLSMSLGFMILIIGVPFAVLFLLSVRGIALVEGRLVEALLGVRMPRRSLFSNAELGWWERLKDLLGTRTWFAVLYMLLQLPLGILYFTVFVTLIALALSFIAAPVMQIVFDVPVIYVNSGAYYLPDWTTPLMSLGGVVLLTATMHLAKFIGWAHGTLAKAILVSD